MAVKKKKKFARNFLQFTISAEIDFFFANWWRDKNIWIHFNGGQFDCLTLILP